MQSIMTNPLKRPILDLLSNNNAVYKEYEIHEILDSAYFDEFIGVCPNELVLFRKHFLVMNALYKLHGELFEQGTFLHISALEIYLEPLKSVKNQTVSGELLVDTAFEKLSRYYLDWNNYDQTNEDDVAALLHQFWKYYSLHNDNSSDLACLNLNADARWPQIQEQYRRLCQQHHPDKGGKAVKFVLIQQAYSNLKQMHKLSKL
jgi:hypothetical protein